MTLKFKYLERSAMHGGVIYGFNAEPQPRRTRAERQAGMRAKHPVIEVKPRPTRHRGDGYDADRVLRAQVKRDRRAS